MKKLKLIVFASLIMIGSTQAQTTGIIKGTLLDEKGNPVLYSPVTLIENNQTISGVNSDEKGDFTFKDLTPGNYDIKATCFGCNTNLIKNVVVDPSQIAYLDVKLTLASTTLPDIIIESTFTQTLINPTYTTLTAIDATQIEQSAMGRDIVSVITTLAPTVMPTDDGKDLLMRGSRRGTTSYIIDGNKLMGLPDVPSLSIASVEVLSGGIPAEYGDVTGGVVIMTTKDYKWEMARKRIKKQKALDAK